MLAQCVVGMKEGYLESLTENEKRVLDAENKFRLGHNQKEKAAKIGLHPSTYSKLFWSIQGKRRKFAIIELKDI